MTRVKKAWGAEEKGPLGFILPENPPSTPLPEPSVAK